MAALVQSAYDVCVSEKGQAKLELQKEALRRRQRRTRAKVNRAVRYAEYVETRRAQCLVEVKDADQKVGPTRDLAGMSMDAVGDSEEGQDVESKRRWGRKAKLDAFLVRRAAQAGQATRWKFHGSIGAVALRVYCFCLQWCLEGNVDGSSAQRDVGTPTSCKDARVRSARRQVEFIGRRQAARWQWWSRVDRYVQKALSCESVDELMQHVATSDPCVAVWYRCMMQGLRARRVGRMRVRCWRPSPGVVQRRRRRGAATLSVCGPLWARPSCLGDEGEIAFGEEERERREDGSRSVTWPLFVWEGGYGQARCELYPTGHVSDCSVRSACRRASLE